MRFTALLFTMIIGLNAFAESADLALDMEFEETASESQAPRAPMAPQAAHTVPSCSSGKYTRKADAANIAAVQSILGVDINSTLHNDAKKASFRLKTSSSVFVVNVSEASGYDLTAEICRLNSRTVRARLVYAGAVRGHVAVSNVDGSRVRVTELDASGNKLYENNIPKTGIFKATAAR